MSAVFPCTGNEQIVKGCAEKECRPEHRKRMKTCCPGAQVEQVGTVTFRTPEGSISRAAWWFQPCP
jgi:hypothetical protein